MAYVKYSTRVCTAWLTCQSSGTRRKHYAKGLCENCYKIAEARACGVLPKDGHTKTSSGRRDYMLQRKYDITLADWSALLLAQGGGCAVPGCDRAPTATDHNHDTGRVRGIMCHKHNVVLHHDISPEDLRFLAAYVERG